MTKHERRQYVDFEVKIEPIGPEFKASVHSPAGDASEFFAFDLPHIESTLRRFREDVCKRGAFRTYRGEEQGEWLTPEAFGRGLFDTLFQGKIRVLLDENLSAFKEDQGLRIKLNIHAPELARLPWEFLYHQDHGGFLCLQDVTPIIRCVEQSPRLRPLTMPLRVLLVSANLADTSVIKDALADRDGQKQVEIEEWTGTATRYLRAMIRDSGQSLHVLHFMGHGLLEQLVLEDRESQEEASAVAKFILQHAPNLHLVVFNACDAGAIDATDAHLGVASALAESGIPAVIAMQFEISDEAALTFSEEFYSALAKGHSVDAAVLWARIAIHSGLGGEAKEWATPVLYMQAETRLIDKSPKVRESGEMQEERRQTVRWSKDGLEKRRTSLQEQLRICRENLNELEVRKAKFGIDVPIAVTNQINDTRAEIQRITAELMGLEKVVVVDDKHEVANLPELYQKGKRYLENGSLQEAIELFFRILRIDSHYEDVGDLLKNAQYTLEVGEREKTGEETNFFYACAQKYIANNKWQKGLAFLELVLRKVPDHEEAKKLIRRTKESLAKEDGERMQREALTILYEKAKEYFDQQEYRKANDLLQDILQRDPNFNNNVQALARKAGSELEAIKEKENRLEILRVLCERGREFFEKRKWQKAIDFLELTREVELENEAMYLGAKELLEKARVERHLEVLYNEGNRYFGERRWQEAIARFSEIIATTKEYEDVKTKLAEAETQLRLERLYEEGARYLEAKQWDKAAIEFKKILDIAPDYKDAKLAGLYAEGMQSFAAKQWQKAIESFKAVLAKDPQYRDTSVKLKETETQKRLYELYSEGTEYSKSEQWEMAIGCFEQICQIDPNYLDAREKLEEAEKGKKLTGLYDRAGLYLRQQWWSEAILVLEEIQKEKEGYKDVVDMLEEAKKEKMLADLYKRGVQYFDANNWKEAIDVFEEIIKIDIDGKYKDVRGKLDRARKEERLSKLYAKGVEAYEEKKWEDAIRYFAQIVREDPSYKDASTRLAQTRKYKQVSDAHTRGEEHLRAQRWKEAVEAFEEVRTLEPGYPGIREKLEYAKKQYELAQLYKKGMQHFYSKQWEEAIESFEQLLEQNPVYKDAPSKLEEAQEKKDLSDLYQKGKKLYDDEKWAEAIAIFERIRTRDRENETVARELEAAKRQQQLDALYQEGIALLAKEQFAQAVEKFSQVCDINPYFKGAAAKLKEAQDKQTLIESYSKGTACYNEENWLGAIEHFEKVMRIDPQYENAAKRLEDAKRYRGLELETETRLLELYTRGMRYLERNQWQEALDFFEQILSTKPDYKDASIARLYAQGLKYLDDRDLPGAIKSFQRVIALGEQYREVSDKLEEAMQGLEKELAELREQADALHEKGGREALRQEIEIREKILHLEEVLAGSINQ